VSLKASHLSWFLLLALQATDAEPAEHPLPLATNYNTGQTGAGFTPQWQMEMIEKGHHLLLTFGGCRLDAKYTEHAKKYHEAALTGAAKKKIPISFACPDFEAALYRDETYRKLPPEDSPLVVGLDGKILDFAVSYPPGKYAGVSPFGVVNWWKHMGRRYTDNELMHKLQEIYPDPPYVVFVSNNEARKLNWSRVEESLRYMEKHGAGKPDVFKQKVTGDGYIERYRALIEGFREGLRQWKDRAVIGAYGGAPLKRMGRTEDWQAWRPPVPGRIAIEPYFWEAVSPSQYITTWNNNSDFTVYGPQTAAMNLVVQKQLFEKVNPKLFWEVSVWDAAFRPSPRAVEKPIKWRQEGQSFPWERYAGFVKWMMWIPRARAVRDFRWWHEPREASGRFPGALNSFGQVIAAVDEVHQFPVLAKFWRQGQLVPNTAHEHPYRHNLPEEVKGYARWFQLDCDANPPWPWGIDTPVEAWSFAYVIGKAPEREWMVFAQAPKSARSNVTVEVPGYGLINVTATQSGSYYHLIEKAKSVTPIVLGGPASVRVRTASQFIAKGKVTGFAVSDVFSPAGELAAFQWDFGDGATAEGASVSHAYAQKGTFVLKLKASGEGGSEVIRTLPIFVDLPPEEGLVVRYSMAPSPTGVLFDASGRNNIGVLHGPTWAEDAERGNVLAFDGKGQYVHIYNNPDLNVWRKESYTSRTTILWFRADRTEGRQMIYEEGGYGSGMSIYLDGNSLYGGVWRRDLWDGTWLSQEGIEPNEWYAVALVLRESSEAAAPGKVELYVDGKKVGTGEGAQLAQHPGDINLGRNGDTRYHDAEARKPGDYFSGQIDDLSIYGRALTKREIKKRSK